MNYLSFLSQNSSF